MTEIAAMITALSLFLIPAGGGLFMYFKTLNQRLTALEGDRVERENEIHTMAWCLKLLLAEVRRLDPIPNNVIIRQVGVMLDQKFPVDPETPADLIAILEAIDRKVAARERKRK